MQISLKCVRLRASRCEEVGCARLNVASKTTHVRALKFERLGHLLQVLHLRRRTLIMKSPAKSGSPPAGAGTPTHKNASSRPVLVFTAQPPTW